jgi:prepilin-type processing-associated H-X9-DG protein
MGLALQMYADDCEGYAPPHNTPIQWASYLSRDFPNGGGYIVEQDMYFCPSYPPRGMVEALDMGGLWIWRTYGMRRGIDFPGAGTPFAYRLNFVENLSEGLQASDFIIIGDSIKTTGGFQAAAYYSTTGFYGDAYRAHLRHSLKGNSLFIDGHVAGVRRGQLIGQYGWSNRVIYDGL